MWFCITSYPVTTLLSTQSYHWLQCCLFFIQVWKAQHGGALGDGDEAWTEGCPLSSSIASQAIRGDTSILICPSICSEFACTISVQLIPVLSTQPCPACILPCAVGCAGFGAVEMTELWCWRKTLVLAWGLCIACGRLMVQEDRNVMSAVIITALRFPGPGRIPNSLAPSTLLIQNGPWAWAAGALPAPWLDLGEEMSLGVRFGWETPEVLTGQLAWLSAPK